jgi:hypothetical protein
MRATPTHIHTSNPHTLRCLYHLPAQQRKSLYIRISMLKYLLFTLFASTGLCQASQLTFSPTPDRICTEFWFWGPPWGRCPGQPNCPIPQPVLQISACYYASEINCGGMFCNGTCHAYGRPGHETYFRCTYETDEQCQAIGATGVCTSEGICDDDCICIRNCCFR